MFVLVKIGGNMFLGYENFVDIVVLGGILFVSNIDF